MIRYTRVLIYTLMVLFANNLFAQDSSVRFAFTKERLNEKEILLKIKAHIAPGIELFSLQKSPDDPLYSNIHFDSSVINLLKDSLISKGAEHIEYDSLVKSSVRYFSDSVEWQQRIRAEIKDSFLLKGTVSYMYKKGEEYLPAEESFKYFIQPRPTLISTSPGVGSVGTSSLWWIFITPFA